MVIVFTLSLDIYNPGGVVYQDFRKLMYFIAALYWAFPVEELRSRAIHSIRELPCGVRLPGGSVVKNMPANAGDVGSIPVSGRSPGGGHGHSLQYSSWEISWTEESDGLQSIGWQRVGHDIETEHACTQAMGSWGPTAVWTSARGQRGNPGAVTSHPRLAATAHLPPHWRPEPRPLPRPLCSLAASFTAPVNSRD